MEGSGPATMAWLARFHAENKLLLLAHSEAEMRSLGRLVANAEGLPGEEVARRYRAGYARALARPLRPGGVVNALEHAAGHFSRVLGPVEKGEFRARVDDYVAGRTSLAGPVALIRAWLERHPRPWVSSQTLLDPARVP
jgi:uncharacterized protein YbgA (DUF1722 family)